MFAQIDSLTFSCALISGVVVALAGALPALFLNELDASSGSKKKKLLSLLLNFAVGSLLGDVFLHLLPDIWQQAVASNSYYEQCLILLLGFFVCVFIERFFNGEPEHSDEQLEAEFIEPEDHKAANHLSTGVDECQTPCLKTSSSNGQHGRSSKGKLKNKANGSLKDCNRTQPNSLQQTAFEQTAPIASPSGADQPTGGRVRRSGSVHVSAYLNLAANVMDNLLHGVSIGGAYLLGVRVGALTTFAVLVHEVPHEISDFAILLRAGLTRTRAARLQIMTGCVSLIGVVFAFLSAVSARYMRVGNNSTVQHSGAQSEVSVGVSDDYGLPWIVPFTIGAFVYISLTSVAPEITRIDEEVRKEDESSMSSRLHGVLQLVALGSGVLLVHMASMLI